MEQKVRRGGRVSVTKDHVILPQVMGTQGPLRQSLLHLTLLKTDRRIVQQSMQELDLVDMLSMPLQLQLSMKRFGQEHQNLRVVHVRRAFMISVVQEARDSMAEIFGDVIHSQEAS